MFGGCNLWQYFLVLSRKFVLDCARIDPLKPSTSPPTAEFRPSIGAINTTKRQGDHVLPVITGSSNKLRKKNQQDGDTDEQISSDRSEHKFTSSSMIYQAAIRRKTLQTITRYQ